MSQRVDLVDDIERRQRLIDAAHEETAAVRAALIAEQLLNEKLLNEKLRFQIAVLKRARYGRSSEQLDGEIAQLEFTIEDLEASVAALRAAGEDIAGDARVGAGARHDAPGTPVDLRAR